MQQETPLPQQQSDEMIPSENSITNINQLIAQIGPLNQTSHYETYVNLMKSILKLSNYLFKKQNNIPSMDDTFDNYLNLFDGVKKFKRQQLYDQIFQDQTENQQNMQQSFASSDQSLIKSVKKVRKTRTLELPQGSLVKCYEKVPFIFFQTNFTFNFNLLSKDSPNIHNTIEQLNQNLDLVQINLFNQIHRKFHQYFKVVANLDYLNQSISININNVRTIRQSIKRCQNDFVIKSRKLRQLIVQRQNIQKVIKCSKTIKSLKKLPNVIQTILDSSLPYECLSLLQSAKDSLKFVKNLKCIESISVISQTCQDTIQKSLNQRYTQQIFNYLFSQCDKLIFVDKWSYITAKNCLDTSLNISGIGDGDSSAFLQNSFIQQKNQDNAKFILRRLQGKQFQIAMILLQSYKYIEFADFTKIKIINYLRSFTKKYQRQLATYFIGFIASKQPQIQQISKQQNNQNTIQILPTTHQAQVMLTQQLVQTLTVDFYVKHLYLLNNIYREILNRYLGYIHTLLTQYEQIASKDSQQNIQKFKKLFDQQFSLLSIIYKFITQKVKSLLLLKNLSGVRYLHFNHWVFILSFWDNYINDLMESHPIIQYTGLLSTVVEQSIKKTLITHSQLKQTINELTIKYITNYHENVLSNEIKLSLEDESWQSIQIPRQLQNLIISITSKDGGQPNISSASLTILNDSSYKTQQKIQFHQSNSLPKINLKIFKNNLLLQGHRYKITMSLLLLCQFIDEYVKMSYLFVKQRNFVLQKLADLIIYYIKMTSQLIIAAKALKLQKFKSKNITAKHMCLLSNCLSVLKILANYITFIDPNPILQQLNHHHNQVHKKLSSVLFQKTQSSVNAQIAPNSQMHISNTNKLILTSYIQMFEIVDDSLDPITCKQIFNQSIKFFMQKYFSYLIQKGVQGKSQAKMILENLKLLRPKFQQQFKSMEKQIQN